MGYQGYAVKPSRPRPAPSANSSRRWSRLVWMASTGMVMACSFLIIGGIVGWNLGVADCRRGIALRQALIDSRQADADDLSVVYLRKGFYDRANVLEGLVTNRCLLPAPHVVLDANLVTRSGAVVDNVSVSIRDLEPRGAWHFRATPLRDDWEQARLVRLVVISN